MAQRIADPPIDDGAHASAPCSHSREGLGGMDVGRLGAAVRDAAPPAVLSLAKHAVRGAGLLTSSARILPDYLIAGTKKGGTTSLANWLVQHPGVLRMFPRAQRYKSAHYFDCNFDDSVAWYRSHFPTRLYRSRVERRLGYLPLVGEASPYYMFHPAAPDRVKSLLPEAKVIMLLREPVSRAYSHYWDRVSTGFEDAPSFEEAIEAEAGRLADADDSRFADPSYAHPSHEHHSYLARSRYAEQLVRWTPLFDPEHLLVLEFERMKTEPDVLLGEVLDFLGLPPCSSIDLRARNERKQQPPLSASTRESLRDYFRPYNRQLAELTGREFSWTRD
ncbi:MAG: sulfotransferase domain-containing protein [Nocardioidaceae bacterium]